MIDILLPLCSISRTQFRVEGRNRKKTVDDNASHGLFSREQELEKGKNTAEDKMMMALKFEISMTITLSVKNVRDFVGQNTTDLGR